MRANPLRTCLVLGLVLASVTTADEVSESPAEEIQHALNEAKTIYVSLLPSPHAHLDSKAGKLSSTIHRPPLDRGWADNLGWSHDGPLTNSLRLLPRVFALFSPSNWFHAIFPRDAKTALKISKSRKEKIEKMMSLITEAEERGCTDVYKFRARMRMFPPKGIKQDLTAAYESLVQHLEYSADPESQFMLAFFYASGIGAPPDQAKAILYYTFSALQGYRPAEMVLGYRHWAGIGVKEDCLASMSYYESAASKGEYIIGAADLAYSHYLAGPPGGRTLLLTPTRLSDRFGGIYGPHASWASSGINSFRSAIQASSALARGETEKELLGFYQYRSDRDAHGYTVHLGRLYYLGSIHILPGGIASGAEGVGEITQDFRKSKEYFTKVARHMWPVDFLSDGSVAPARKMSKEQESYLHTPAAIAASFLGRMALRGEGGKLDHRRARLWYERAADLGEREAMNGLGIIYRDGLSVLTDKAKAKQYFQSAAGQDLAEAQVNLAKLHLERNEVAPATELLNSALRHGSTFESFHLLGNLHATAARLPSAPGVCGVVVAYQKIVAERGNWYDDFIGEADRAWARGEEDKAILGWWIAAEMGYEAAQNNIAYVLSQGTVPSWVPANVKMDRELEMWVRSAAQDNVDSMVKVGDYFYQGVGVTENRYERAANYYQTAADTQLSAMAYWNLGWMYENGQGVSRDWHLAKRFYDLSYDVSAEAYLPVLLSLIGLYLRSWWIEMKSGGAIPGLSLFEVEDDGQGLSDMSNWDRIKLLWTSPMAMEDEVEEVTDFGGSGWGEGGGDGLENDDDLFETMIILGLAAMAMGLMWFRGRWARREIQQQREANAREDAALARGEVARPRDDGFPIGWEPPIP